MIEIRNLRVNVGEFKIHIEGFKINRGDYLIIVGPTGAGKTILLETIAGFHVPQEGKILLNGKDITNLPPHKREVSMVYQDYMLFPNMSVEENIAYPLRVRKIEWKKKVRNIAKKLGIEDILHRNPKTLSGGEMQRVALARAVITSPKLLLLDEPFSALDPGMRDNARRVVRDFIKELEIPTIHVTHDFSDAWVLGNKMGVMRNGKMVRFGVVEDVFADPQDDFVAKFLGASNIIKGIAGEMRNGLSPVEIDGLIVYTVDEAQAGDEVLLSIRPENIVLSYQKPTGSQRNVLPCRVVDINVEGHIVWISLKAGNIILKAMLTPNALESMGIEKNKKIYVSFKATATKIVRRI